MAEHLTSGQMLHSDHKSWLTPLYVRRPRGLERGPRRGETLHLSEKLFPLISIKRDENYTSLYTLGDSHISDHCAVARA